MSFAELVIFVDGVGYSLAARSRDEMFIKKQCILWYLLLKLIFRLFNDMLQLYHWFVMIFLEKFLRKSKNLDGGDVDENGCFSTSLKMVFKS